MLASCLLYTYRHRTLRILRCYFTGMRYLPVLRHYARHQTAIWRLRAAGALARLRIRALAPRNRASQRISPPLHVPVAHIILTAAADAIAHLHLLTQLPPAYRHRLRAIVGAGIRGVRVLAACAVNRIALPLLRARQAHWTRDEPAHGGASTRGGGAHAARGVGAGGAMAAKAA